MRNKRNRKKIIIIVVVLLSIAGLAVALFARHSEQKGTEVDTKKAVITDITAMVNSFGKVKPRTHIKITAEVNSEIVAIPVHDGQKVSRGELLIQLDTVQLKEDLQAAESAVRELEARLEAARLSLKQAERALKRISSLYDRKMASETEYQTALYDRDNQRYTLKALEEQLKAENSQLSKARDNLGKAAILSPINGVVTSIDVEVGEIAPAQTSFSQGKILMTVSDMESFEVEVEVDETDISKIEIGQLARVQLDAFPDTFFKGKVYEIGNTAMPSSFGNNEQATNFRVKVLMQDIEQNIKPGMSATVDIITHRKKSVVAVPIQAIVIRTDEEIAAWKESKKHIAGKQKEKKNGESLKKNSELDKDTEKDLFASQALFKHEGVFLFKQNKARFVEVSTGIADMQLTEIHEGLTQGEEVIIGPFKALRSLADGDPVKHKKAVKAQNKDNS